MNLTLEEIKVAVAARPASERAELVQFLLRSLDDPDEDQVHAAWLALAEQRMAELRGGQVQGIPAENLWDDLPATPEVVPVHDWQKEELARRKANLLENPASGLSWEEVKRRIGSRHGR
jgi:putative addiction module component (TIGR02574 family)